MRERKTTTDDKKEIGRGKKSFRRGAKKRVWEGKKKIRACNVARAGLRQPQSHRPNDLPSRESSRNIESEKTNQGKDLKITFSRIWGCPNKAYTIVQSGNK